MGWVIFGVVIWIIASKRSTRGCVSRRRRRAPRQIESRQRTASEAYRMRTELEDMDRRMQIAERSIQDQDDYLRRQFQNLS